MKIDRVKYKDGRPYIEYIHKSGKLKGYIKRDYGQIINCKTCGEEHFSSNSHLKEGWGKFCSVKCARQLENNPKWKNGRKKRSGYVLIKNPNHPNKDSQGYVYEHRLIIEKQIGRYLHQWEIVHHINKIKVDNRPENLMAFANESSHQRFEAGGEIESSEIIFNGCKKER